MTELGITAKDWKPNTSQNSSNLMGFLTICVPVPGGSLAIQGCRYFYDASKPEGKQQWVSFPERPYQKDGETKYAKIIWTEPLALSDQIRSECVKAANALYHGTAGQPSQRKRGGW